MQLHLTLFQFLFSKFFVAFLWNTLQNQSCNVPEHSESNFTSHSSESYTALPFCFERDNPSPSLSMTQRVVNVYFLRTATKLSIYNLNLLHNFNAACSSVSLQRQLKT
jgi:hypothetical protein